MSRILLGGCDGDGHGSAKPTEPSSSAPPPPSGSTPPLTALPTPVTRSPAPPLAAVTRLVVDSPDDPTSVTVDVPPAAGGYVVEASCDGRPGTSVSWALARVVGPVGDRGGATVPCDGAGHTAAALAGSTVAVQVRLTLTADLSAVSWASAVLRPAP